MRQGGAARSRHGVPALRRSLLLLIAILILPLGAGAATRPFSVRDIPVGMSLGEFRRLHHPDAEQHPDAKVYCSTDPGVGGIEALTMPATFLQADTLKCGFFQLAPAADGERLASVPMIFLGEEITPLFLFSRPEGARDYALTQITFAMSNRQGGPTIELFYRAFGGATSLDVTGVGTAFGSDMSNIRYVWRNELSTIQLDSLSFVLTEMSVVFYDNRLWNDLSERVATIERMNRIANQEEQRLREAREAAARNAEKAASEPPVLPPAESTAVDSKPKPPQ
jgi:hypothetical protein